MYMNIFCICPNECLYHKLRNEILELEENLFDDTLNRKHSLNIILGKFDIHPDIIKKINIRQYCHKCEKDYEFHSIYHHILHQQLCNNNPVLDSGYCHSCKTYYIEHDEAHQNICDSKLHDILITNNKISNTWRDLLVNRDYFLFAIRNYRKENLFDI